MKSTERDFMKEEEDREGEEEKGEKREMKQGGEGWGSALAARSVKPTLAFSGLADGTARLSHQPRATN